MRKKERGVDATNQDFIRYDQVAKKQSYRLAEDAVVDVFDDEYVIRTCDLGRFLHGGATDRAAFAQQLGGALQDIGFAVLENTGIDPASYDEASERVRSLFTNCTLEEKMRFRAARHGSVNQGYFPIKETSDIHPDLVEGWVFCRRAFDQGRYAEFWPMVEHAPFFHEHCMRHERLFLPIMRSLLAYLGQEPQIFDERLTDTNFGLRLNYYPPVPSGEQDSGAGRLLGHEDVDMFTLLPAPQVEGLQVLNRQNGKWVRLHPPRGTIIINVGDYLQRISNDVLPSTTHRVSRPRDLALAQQARVSFPLAVYLWENEMIEVLPGLGEPRYEAVRAIEFHTRTTSKFYGDDYAVG